MPPMRGWSEMADRSVVLFGAGASYLDGGKDRPPLMRGLFAPLRNRFPDTWGTVPSNEAPAFSVDFEKAMNEVAASTDLLAEMTTDMALFLGGFVPRPCDEEPYCRFLRRSTRLIRARRLVVATLNYDCLIELAAERVGYSFPPYYFRPGDGLRLLKLHGSSNFIVKQDGITVKDKLTMKLGSGYDSIIEPCHPRDLTTLLGRHRFPPAMALVTPGKPVLSCHRQIEEVQRIYAKEVARANRVAVIGANPNDDAHVWNPLVHSKGKIGFVGNEEACGRLASMREGAETILLDGKLETALDELENFLLI